MTKLMKRFGAACLFLGVTCGSAFAATITQWTFETNTPADVTNAAISGIVADIGSGTASGLHASATTAWTTPVGNGSANSLSATAWAVGDYFQFQTGTVGYSGISLSWDQTSSNTGPRDFQLSYSTNGTTFTNFGSSFSVLANATPNPTWSAGTPQPIFGFSRDLSGVSALDNQANVYFRLVDASTVSANGGVVAATGTGRVDNFTVLGTVNAVPEPETYGMLLAGLGLLGFAARRRAKSE